MRLLSQCDGRGSGEAWCNAVAGGDVRCNRAAPQDRRGAAAGLASGEMSDGSRPAGASRKVDIGNRGNRIAGHRPAAGGAYHVNPPIGGIAHLTGRLSAAGTRIGGVKRYRDIGQWRSQGIVGDVRPRRCVEDEFQD